MAHATPAGVVTGVDRWSAVEAVTATTDDPSGEGRAHVDSRHITVVD